MSIQWGVSVKAAKGGFFDRDKVMAAIDKATYSRLSKFGAWVRRTAQTSIRTRKKPSAPGKPPSNHTGLLKKWILFFYEPSRKSVVIGPAKLNARSALNLGANGQPIPQTLEHGGSVNRSEYLSKTTGEWTPLTSSRTARRVKMNGNPVRKRTVSIAARPFMKPAFDLNLKKMNDLWSNSVNQAA